MEADAGETVQAIVPVNTLIKVMSYFVLPSTTTIKPLQPTLVKCNRASKWDILRQTGSCAIASLPVAF